MLKLSHRFLKTSDLDGKTVSYSAGMTNGSLTLLPTPNQSDESKIFLLMKKIDDDKYIELKIKISEDKYMFFSAVLFCIEEGKKLDPIVAENTTIWLDSIFNRMLELSITK
ncbi:hypothetical protein [Glaciecola petra]|uniref:Uncharacterized protein n=1 Tax=Glaciecola petra TaxID=3075602 RepID=A0ABU2ZQ58_9ALTE|nr:hypothetical protein [Aestuariibacter sp. P117]MDT0594545.1 hypothetical protein [Aestuariibacter sp. P117]